MRCIFCKNISDTSRGVEHIIPEALGNKNHVLPRGVVCERCNNYFARKVEQPFLNSVQFRNLRGRQAIENKRGNVPPQTAWLPSIGAQLHIYSDDSGLSVGPARERDNNVFINHLKSTTSEKFIIPITWPIDPRIVSRFLAKVAIEILAQRLLPFPDWEDALIENPQLDPLRRYARTGDAPTLWPFHSRRIYGEDALAQEDGDHWQVLHEYTLLYTEQRELYAVICMFGTEYSINMGGPEIEGYEKWVATHNGESPLYPDPSTTPINPTGGPFVS